MTNRDLVRLAYLKHRSHAKERGIPFLLTYEQWCTIWMESGKWEQRGYCRGQYVMARCGDRGAYELGNVVILLAEENVAQRNKNYTGDRHPNYGKSLWQTFKNLDQAKFKFGKSTSIVATRRTRDVLGRFVEEESLGPQFSE